MQNGLNGKTFVIVGATSGIGTVLAKALSQDGANTVLIARDKVKLEGIAKGLSQSVFTAQLDVSRDTVEQDLTDILENAKNSLSVESFNGGVYCSGVAPILPLRGLSSKIVDDVFRVNYTGAVLFTKIMASKAFRHKEMTSVVLISSVSAKKGEKGLGIYGASKAALGASARSFARELAPQGVRVNCIMPGWIDTEMNIANSQVATGIEDTMRKLHPLGLGTAQNVSDAILFLLSEKSSWITGTNMIVDGGFLA